MDSMEDGVGSCQGQSRGGRWDKGERDGKECILKLLAMDSVLGGEGSRHRIREDKVQSMQAMGRL